MGDLEFVDRSVARLRQSVELAETPAELTAVLDVAEAIETHARRLVRAALAGDDIEMARAAYRAQIEGVFGRLEVIRRIAGKLPKGSGRPAKSSDHLRISDFGISYDTAARWNDWAEVLGDGAPLIDERARWFATVDELDPGRWDDPRLGVIVGRLGWTTPDPVDTPPAPVDRYRCIVIDPPWPVRKITRDERPRQGPDLDYPTMTVEQIAALPVGEWAADDGCHLYLWVTHRHLPVGLDLLNGWGARYECVLTWRKNVGMTPFSWMYDTEHVLFARMGTLPLGQNGLRLSIDAPTTGHSRKPDAFYDRVRAASPGPRVELFARQSHDGFTPWRVKTTEATDA